MVKLKYQICIKGVEKTWGFEVYGTPQHAEDWRKDGFDVWEITNQVPDWVPWWLCRCWARAQDVFNFRWRS